MKFIFRKAVLKDKYCIEKLYIEMLQTIYQKKDVTGYENDYLNKFFNNSKNRIYVVETNGKVIAFISIEEYNEHLSYLYIDDFSVSKNYRGLGIGTELIKIIERYAKNNNISEIRLHVEKSNIRAYKLYLRMKFKSDKLEESRIRMKNEL